ncbi:MSHA biogenesis protein MshM [hydrothermal vent metagenome]|uniref:MSHA biogenesis protein MshM n=1 Tax=hydrothermal vent metagenome TaxID=652676 RepID=A0A1W1D4Z4_9ZZZZ
MDENLFIDAKNVFLDTVNADEYIHLERISILYDSLKKSILKPLKMVLLYGKPGTGKSMFLSKLYKDLVTSEMVFFYKTPILDESEFFKILAQDILGVRYEDTLNFTHFMKIMSTKNLQSTPIILLDEAQLYPNTLMEKIRLLSDTRSVKFVIALHKTHKEDLIAKEHFQTRIWESIELKNATISEQGIYIQKKLLRANCYDVAHMFDKSSLKLIYQLTYGNYRTTHKLLFTLFEIYILYIQQNKKNKFSKTKISKKFIEMAAIHLGLIRG